VVEYPPPGEDGLTTCPDHPGAGRFEPAKCCPSCTPLAGSGEVETPVTDRILADLAAKEAADRGVPDMLDLELFIDKARRDCRSEQKVCREIAKRCESRAQDILDGRVVITTVDREGGTVDADQDRAAQHWFDVAAKYRAGVAKSLDTQAKLGKLALGPASERYRALHRKQRAKLRGKETN
jgi:hypothetical protein